MDNFNPRSREGSDVTKACFEPCLKISIHAPAKGATRSRRKRGCSGRFQSTLPRRERLLQASIIKRFDNFNPRSREGSDTALKPKTLGGIISIHAPAKGATSSLKFTVQNFLFQSTLPRRERRSIFKIKLSIFLYFNPRSREGSDKAYPDAKGLFCVFQSTLPRRERHSVFD